jgi:hypothetical protein
LFDHRDRLRRSNRFGYHLVKVSPVALAASRRAHDRHVEETEELEHCQKRRRIEVASHSSNERYLFERAMQICYEQGSLSSNLDVLDISWMRLSGDRTFTKFAAKVASERMGQLRMTYTASLLGSYSDDSGLIKNYFDNGDFVDVRCGPYPLESSKERPGLFVPFADHQQISWENTGENSCPPETPQSLFLRISIRLEGTDPVSTTSSGDPPERDCLFQQPIEVGWYQIDLPSHLGDSAVVEGPLTVSSQQTPCSTLAVQVSPVGLSFRRGNLSLTSLTFEFHHLLGIYARKKLPLAKQHMMELKKQRPVTRAEKDYVRAIAFAARQAPGCGERTFVGLSMGGRVPHLVD